MQEPTREQRFAEDMGRSFDLWSMPRMAGRVWGYLIVSEEPALSAQQLAEGLHASAGSISASTRFLLQERLIERVRLPGERREFFRFEPSSPFTIFRQRIDAVSLMHRTFELAMPRFEDITTAHERLDRAHEFYDWLEVELDALMTRWRNDHAEPEGGSGS